MAHILTETEIAADVTSVLDSLNIYFVKKTLAMKSTKMQNNRTSPPKAIDVLVDNLAKENIQKLSSALLVPSMIHRTIKAVYSRKIINIIVGSYDLALENHGLCAECIKFLLAMVENRESGGKAIELLILHGGIKYIATVLKSHCMDISIPRSELKESTLKLLFLVTERVKDSERFQSSPAGESSPVGKGSIKDEGLQGKLKPKAFADQMIFHGIASMLPQILVVGLSVSEQASQLSFCTLKCLIFLLSVRVELAPRLVYTEQYAVVFAAFLILSKQSNGAAREEAATFLLGLFCMGYEMLHAVGGDDGFANLCDALTSRRTLHPDCPASWCIVALKNLKRFRSDRGFDSSAKRADTQSLSDGGGSTDGQIVCKGGGLKSYIEGMIKAITSFISSSSTDFLEQAESDANEIFTAFSYPSIDDVTTDNKGPSQSMATVYKGITLNPAPSTSKIELKPISRNELRYHRKARQHDEVVSQSSPPIKIGKSSIKVDKAMLAAVTTAAISCEKATITAAKKFRGASFGPPRASAVSKTPRRKPQVTLDTSSKSTEREMQEAKERKGQKKAVPRVINDHLSSKNYEARTGGNMSDIYTEAITENVDFTPTPDYKPYLDYKISPNASEMPGTGHAALFSFDGILSDLSLNSTDRHFSMPEKVTEPAKEPMMSDEQRYAFLLASVRVTPLARPAIRCDAVFVAQHGLPLFMTGTAFGPFDVEKLLLALHLSQQMPLSTSVAVPALSELSSPSAGSAAAPGWSHHHRELSDDSSLTTGILREHRHTSRLFEDLMLKSKMVTVAALERMLSRSSLKGAHAIPHVETKEVEGVRSYEAASVKRRNQIKYGSGSFNSTSSPFSPYSATASSPTGFVRGKTIFDLFIDETDVQEHGEIVLENQKSSKASNNRYIKSRHADAFDKSPQYQNILTPSPVYVDAFTLGINASDTLSRKDLTFSQQLDVMVGELRGAMARNNDNKTANASKS